VPPAIALPPVDGIARVAADAAAVAPNDLTINPICTAVIAERPQPPTTPEVAAAPSTLGSSLKITTGLSPAIAKQANPENNAPSADAPALAPVVPGAAPAWASSLVPTTRVIEIAGLASTNANVR